MRRRPSGTSRAHSGWVGSLFGLSTFASRKSGELPADLQDDPEGAAAPIPVRCVLRVLRHRDPGTRVYARQERPAAILGSSGPSDSAPPSHSELRARVPAIPNPLSPPELPVIEGGAVVLREDNLIEKVTENTLAHYEPYGWHH